jgi:pimeloyl-ACP methyl ester carboxylesterase
VNIVLLFRNTDGLLLAGHGESPRPHNFVYMGLEDLSRDLQATLNYILLEDTSMPEPVIVAHSSGGGLAQYALANSQPHDDPLFSGLVLLASIPPYGMHRVLLAWMRLDPWYIPRFLYHMGDLRSPLSTLPLVRRAYFGSHTPPGVVQGFLNSCMNHEETVTWMRDMVFRYVEPNKVITKVPGRRIFCIGGDQDALITPDIVRGTANEYGVGGVLVSPAGVFSFVFLVFDSLCFARTSYTERRLMECGS